MTRALQRFVLLALFVLNNFLVQFASVRAGDQAIATDSVPPVANFSQANASPVNPQQVEEAVDVFRCEFNESDDKDYDGFPDYWERGLPPKYPHYLKIEITTAENDATRLPRILKDEKVKPFPTDNPKEQFLRIQMDGGGALIQKPDVPIDPLYTYKIEAKVRVMKLVRDDAYLSVTYYDHKGNILEVQKSAPLTGTHDWRTVSIESRKPPKAQAVKALLGIHVEPRGKTADLTGIVDVKSFWIGKLPRITLLTNKREQIFVENEKPIVSCQISGMQNINSEVIFELLDIDGNLLGKPFRQNLSKNATSLINESTKKRPAAGAPSSVQSVKKTASPEKIHLSSKASAQTVPGDASAASDDDILDSETASAPQLQSVEQSVFSGTVSWSPTIHEPGFYRVRVTLPGQVGAVNQKEISLVVMRSLPNLSYGEFGWSLPTGEGPLTFRELADLAGQSGVHWVKLPVWSAAGNQDREKEMLWFAERLGIKRIEMVGVLSDPPESVRVSLAGVNTQHAAGLFSAPVDAWFKNNLEPVISRLSVRVRHWQLGNDYDHSFIGYPDTDNRVTEIRKLFSRFGSRMYFGVGWNWLRELPSKKPSWDFAVLSTNPGLTSAEQKVFLTATANREAQRWTIIEPISTKNYTPQVQAADLARRMITAKAYGADGIFIAKLFDDNTGLLRSDGTVGPLYVPWRNTAWNITGSELVGQLQLAPHVHNFLFMRGTEHNLVLWSEQPEEIMLQVGTPQSIYDIWGQEVPYRRGEGDAIYVKVDATPIFLNGVNGGLIRFQITTDLASHDLSNLFARPQPNGVILTNSFPQSITGKAHIVTPESWRTTIRDISFKIAPRETVTLPFDIVLPGSIGTGRHDIGIEIDIEADRPYHFVTTRAIEVGVDDIFAEYSTRLTARGDLEVEQRLTNQTDEIVNFKCYLIAPDRKRISIQVLDHGRGIDTKTFRIPQAQDLIGKEIAIQAEEVNGSRILNYLIRVQQ